MRQIDSPENFGELKRAEKPAPEARPEWVPTGTPHIERNVKDGRLRNVAPEPPPDPLPYMIYWGRSTLLRLR
jgi:hypothetical protein